MDINTDYTHDNVRYLVIWARGHVKWLEREGYGFTASIIKQLLDPFVGPWDELGTYVRENIANISDGQIEGIIDKAVELGLVQEVG